MSAKLIPDLAVDKLIDPPKNPNAMAAADYQALLRNIREQGFLQPILAQRLPGDGDELYEIVDGCHRTSAARDLGLTHIPAVVLASDAPVETAQLLQISMNRLRGQLDLTSVATTLAELSETGVDVALSGFSESELGALLDVTVEVDPNEIDTGLLGEKPEKKEKETAFELKISLDSADELREIKRLLRKAAGRGQSMGRGLRKVLGLE